MSTYTLPVKHSIFVAADNKEHLALAFSQFVSGISIVATGTGAGPISLFHSKIFLVLPNNISVVLNPTPQILYPTGEFGAVIEIAHENNASTTDLERTREYEQVFTRSLTVADVLTFLFDRKLDQYVFNQDGAGCRTWCATVLHELEMSGIVPVGAMEAFVEWEANEHAVWGDRFPLQRIVGRFYQ